ncbi:ankyrin repeat-containing domain protein [Baffinella frigidus]|nr:ankyrin repeat-containing domain protein [Cryptophyta sp. CCMP2293]
MSDPDSPNSWMGNDSLQEDGDTVTDNDSSHSSDEDEDVYWVSQLEPYFRRLYTVVVDTLNSRGGPHRQLLVATLRDVLYTGTVDINTITVDGFRDETLLDRAVDHADIDIVNILLEHRADPNIICGPPTYRHNCLFTSCLSYHDTGVPIALTLIKHGVDINAKMPQDPTSSGFRNMYSTVLHCACKEWNFEFVRLLLENHADVNAVDSMGMTPLACAVKTNGADVKCFKKGAIRTIEVLVEYGADLHATDRFGQTLLHIAAAVPRGEYNMDVVRYLVDGGVSDLRDMDGMTASDVAVKGHSSNLRQRHASKLFCTRLRTMLQERCQHLVAFAMGNRQRGKGLASRRVHGAHDWRRIAKGSPS